MNHARDESDCFRYPTSDHKKGHERFLRIFKGSVGETIWQGEGFLIGCNVDIISVPRI